MTSSVQWFPERLTATIQAGFRASWADALKLAVAQTPAPGKAGAVLRPTGSVSAALEPTGIGGIFEHGRRGGYEIQPIRKQALKIGTGFAAYATGGPMRPDPYIGPAASEWASGIAQARMRAFLAGAGFR